MPISRIPGAGLETTGTASVNTFLRGDNAWAGTITSGTAQTASGTTVNFNNVIPSTAKRITVMFSGVSVTTNTTVGYVQLGTGATPTYVTTGYLSTGTQMGASTVSGSNYTVGFPALNQSAAASTFQGVMIITNISGNIWTAFGSVSENASGRQFVSSGAITLADVLTSVRVSHADTFDAGTINIMWEG